MAIVEMQPPRPENNRRELELPAPVLDDRSAEEVVRPRVHLPRHRVGRRQEHVSTANRQREVALIVERHGTQLAQRILAIEHPAVGAG